MINQIARKAEKVLFAQFEQANVLLYFSIDTTNTKHREQLTVILHFAQCSDKSDPKANEAFGDYVRVNGSTEKGLLIFFPKRSEE